MGLRVGVRATDGTESAEVYHTITVANLEPTITSTPGVEAGVRREYRYEIVVEDPAGALDPIDYRLTSRPPGATIEENVITWVPEPEHRGLSFPAIIRLDDGDGGEAMQSWMVAVANNTLPEPPVPTAPIERARVAEGEPVTLTVENGSDLDEDPLLYFFRLSRLSTFDSPDTLRSGEVAQGDDGTTSWTTAEPLPSGLWYWQVWVSDGIAESERVYASLVVGNMEPGPDAGVPAFDGSIPGLDGGDGGDGGGGGGCAVGRSGGAPAGALWLLLATAWLVRRERRGR